MRSLIVGLSLVCLAVAVTSCTPEKGTAKGGGESVQPPTATGPAQAEMKNTYVFASAGKGVLKFTLPEGAKVATTEDATTFTAAKGGLRFNLWEVPDARTLDQAAAKIGPVIRSEFLAFKFASSKDITVSGVPAKQLDGSGKEADDGDPGNARIVLFAMGPHVFAACAHGEGDAVDSYGPFMMSVLGTASKP